LTAEARARSSSRRRPVRSFVRREGRITEAQRRALETLSSRYQVPGGEGVLDLAALYGREAERYLEIGCGAGETLVTLAARHPENDYLGIEVYRPGLGRLMRDIAAAALVNVSVLVDDAAEALAERVSDRALSGVYLFFPDPWPKSRHHKRRLIQPPFATLLREKLRPHGRVFVATDWEDYALHILSVMSGEAGFVNLAGTAAFAPRPSWRPLTRYEERARRRGHVVRDMVFAPASPDCFLPLV
jgi:tRNA (guanine-N7-)-methyltransferase